MDQFGEVANPEGGAAYAQVLFLNGRQSSFSPFFVLFGLFLLFFAVAISVSWSGPVTSVPGTRTTARSPGSSVSVASISRTTASFSSFLAGASGGIVMIQSDNL